MSVKAHALVTQSTAASGLTANARQTTKNIHAVSTVTAMHAIMTGETNVNGIVRSTDAGQEVKTVKIINVKDHAMTTDVSGMRKRENAKSHHRKTHVARFSTTCTLALKTQSVSGTVTRDNAKPYNLTAQTIIVVMHA